MNYFRNKEERIVQAKEHVQLMYKHYSEEMADTIAHSKILMKKDCDKLEKDHLERNIAEGQNILLEMCGIREAIFTFERKGQSTNSVVLNFASFKHPGGMFLKGSSAQEESLCHCSTLYPVLKYHSDFYERHKSMLHDGLYETEILYTPDIIFIVKQKGETEDNKEKTKIIPCDVITCAAPNAGSARRNGVSEEDIVKEMKSRIRSILEFSYSIGAKRIYLGAYGCGVFQNDTLQTAIAFKEALYKYDFEEVIFPIPDRPNFLTFQSVFMD